MDNLSKVSRMITSKRFVYLIHICLLLFLLKKLFTYLLLLLFSFQTFEIAFIVMNFKVNQDFFAQICENKDKPEMECNGKCHLKKQIKKQEEQKSKKEKINIEKEIQNCILITNKILPQPKTKVVGASSLYNFIHKPRNCISDVFHPPQA